MPSPQQLEPAYLLAAEVNSAMPMSTAYCCCCCRALQLSAAKFTPTCWLLVSFYRRSLSTTGPARPGRQLPLSAAVHHSLTHSLYRPSPTSLHVDPHYLFAPFNLWSAAVRLLSIHFTLLLLQSRRSTPCTISCFSSVYLCRCAIRSLCPSLTTIIFSARRYSHYIMHHYFSFPVYYNDQEIIS